MPRLGGLVGRHVERDALVTQLARDDVSVVALFGPVGVGKTFLADHVAAHVEESGLFSRVVRVDTADVTSDAELREGLAEALGVRTSGVLRALDAAGDVLVLLDGLDGLPRFDRAVAPWLGAAPQARVLVTVRARPEGDDLVALPLAPLAVPTGDALEGPAAELLLRCIARRRAEYAPTRGELPFLAELLRELDGLPLAIELAAPRLEVMGPAALLHRLRTSSAKGSSPALGSTREGRSLETALSGVWQSLSATLRGALAMLSVFPADFALEAAEDVVVLATPPGEPAISVVDAIEALRARSLLETRTDPDEVRLSVLRTVRSFVARVADAETLRAARARHAQHYATLAERAVALDFQPDPRLVRRLSRERAHLLGVVESVLDGRPIDKRRAEPALRALVALFAGGHEAPPARTLAILKPTMDATRDSGADPALVARAHLVAGAAYRAAGDRPAAVRELTRALHVATTLGAGVTFGAAMLEMSRLLAAAGELDEARRHAHVALLRFGELARPGDEASALVVLGEVGRRRGETVAAAEALARATALFVELGDAAGEARARRAHARLLLDLGRHDDVAAELARLGTTTTSADHRLEAELLAAWSSHDRGARDEASIHYASVVDDAVRLGLSSIEAAAAASRGALAMEAGEDGRAHVHFRSAFPGPERDRGELAPFRALAAVIDAAIVPSAAAIVPSAAASATSAASHALDEVTTAIGSLVDAPSKWTSVEADLRRLGATRLFARLALRALSFGARARLPARHPDDALVIEREGLWFRPPGAEVVDLSRRRPLARILAHLLEARLATPDTKVARDALERAGWPGERMLPAAAAHRVRVAVSTLRKVGLGTFLLTRGDGYLLDARCPMLRDDG